MPTSSKESSYTVGHRKGREKAARVRQRISAHGKAKTHRSFRRTRRRDYIRPLVLPGIVSMTLETGRTLWRRRKVFLPLMAIYAVLYIFLVGVGSQDAYTELGDFFTENSEDLLEGGFGAVSQMGITVATLAVSGLRSDISEAQQIFAVLLGLMAWLTTVWILRNSLAGHKVKVRDGLYNAGAPIISTFVIILVIVAQLLPLAITAMGYSAAVSAGIVSGGGAPAMLFWGAAVLLAGLSAYWITSSLFALVIVTLPGMYPLRALRSSSAIIFGRRLKVLLRWAWMVLCGVVLWVLIMAPIILIDMGLKALWPQIEWVPIVPFGLLLASTYVIFWAATYVYLFYRKVVDNE